MQIWTDEGFRNLWCSSCRVQHRANGWHCSHDMPVHTCPEHRVDPAEHLTTKVTQKRRVGEQTVVLLPSTRGEPLPKRTRNGRVSMPFSTSAIKRKGYVQCIHPNFYRVDLAKCPKLARKFTDRTTSVFSSTTESSNTPAATGATNNRVGSSSPVRRTQGEATTGSGVVKV